MLIQRAHHLPTLSLETWRRLLLSQMFNDVDVSLMSHGMLSSILNLRLSIVSLGAVLKALVVGASGPGAQAENSGSFTPQNAQIVNDLWTYMVQKVQDEISWDAINEGRVHPIFVSLMCKVKEW